MLNDFNGDTIQQRFLWDSTFVTLFIIKKNNEIIMFVCDFRVVFKFFFLAPSLWHPIIFYGSITLKLNICYSKNKISKNNLFRSIIIFRI